MNRGHYEEPAQANRATRSAKLTDAGRIYLERVSGLLDGLAETEVRLSDAQDTVRGTLQFAAPPAFGAFYLAPIIARFMAQHPEVRVRLDLSDRRFDLVEEAIPAESIKLRAAVQPREANLLMVGLVRMANSREALAEKKT